MTVEDAKRAMKARGPGALSRAYREVFGRPGARTAAQTRVLRDLYRVCGADASSVSMGPDGHCDPIRVGMLEGQRLVWLRIFKEYTRDEDPIDALENLTQTPPGRRVA